MSWTEAQVRALGVTTDLETAAKTFGVGRSMAYELAARGGFPCPVLRLGKRYRVPTAGILVALGITSPASAQPDTAPTVVVA